MTSEIEDLKTALGELQTQLAFQEDTVDALNRALSAQQQEILTLRRQLALLKQQVEEQAAAQGEARLASADEEKPPHY